MAPASPTTVALPPETSPRPLWRQVLTELWYALLFLTVHQLLDFLRPLPDHPQGHRRPVVLVSGLMGACASWKAMRAALIARGHPVYIARTGTSLKSILLRTRVLCRFLEARGLSGCCVLGHSMGGLVALCALAETDRIARVITLGTPFRGTWLAPLLPVFPSVLQVIPGSRFLRRVAMLIAEHASKLHPCVARFDEVVLQASSASCGLPEHTRMPALGHCNIFMEYTCTETVCRLLETTETAASSVGCAGAADGPR